MKTKLKDPVFVAHHPQLQLGAYLVESDSDDPYQHQIVLSGKPITSMGELPQDVPPQSLGTILNPSLGWRILSAARPYLGNGVTQPEADAAQ